MDLLCDICLNEFDLISRQPKSLPCGHTLCQECVSNPCLHGKCPTCRKDLGADPSDFPNNFPNNIFVIQLMEKVSKPPQGMPRNGDTQFQLLQRAVDAGRELLEQLQAMVPSTIAGLLSLQDSAAARVQKLEEALADLQPEEAAGGDGARLVVADAEDLLQTGAQLEESLRLLRSQCRVVAEQVEGGARWTASAPQGPAARNLCSLLLLQLQATGDLDRADGHPSPAAPVTSDLDRQADDGASVAARTPYVGPPGISILTVGESDFDEDRLKVDDILLDEKRWRHARSVRELWGDDCEGLLRVLAPQLEELVFADEAQPGPSVMEVVRTMKSLRILSVQPDEDLEPGYPDLLPLQLEELCIRCPSELQLSCVQRMPRLRSLEVGDYCGAEVSFPPSQHGGLLWLSVWFDRTHQSTMLSLIRAHAPSLQYLQVYCLAVDDWDPDGYFFPDLAERLAESGLVSLRQLVLERQGCAKISECLLQLRAFRALLPTVAVSCKSCRVLEPAAI